MNISLSELEQNIFNTFVEVNKSADLNLTLRVYGEWVLAKLLGKDNDDIKIYINNSAILFASQVAKRIGLGDNKGALRAGNKPNSVVINIFGKSIEITEVKDKDLAGEIFEKDFTVNSLLYNLNLKTIEDISGNGKKDINLKTVRFVLPQKDRWEKLNIKNNPDANLWALKKDPVYAIDAIQIACKYNLELSREIVKLLKETDMSKLLDDKTKIQKVFRNILMGPSPERALHLLKELNILDNIIQLPANYCNWDMDQNTPHHELTVWEHTLTVIENLQTIIGKANLSDNDRFLLNMAALLHDTGKLNPSVQGKKKHGNGFKTTYYNHEESSVNTTKSILSKLPGITIIEIYKIQKLIKGSSKVNPNYIPGNQDCNLTNKTLSKFVSYMGNDWQKAIFLNMADAAGKRKGQLKEFDFNYHSNMISKIRSLGPKKIMNMKPLLSGAEVISIINKEPGKWVSDIMTKLIGWQFKNPKATKKDAEGFVSSLKKNE